MIMNITGQTVLKQSIAGLYQTRIDVAHLSAGVYILRYVDDEKLVSRKWIKK